MKIQYRVCITLFFLRVSLMLCCQAESELLGQSSSPNSAFQACAQVCVILLDTHDLSLRQCQAKASVAGAFTCEQK